MTTKVDGYTLLPTHHCFDDALDYIEQRVIRDPWLASSSRLRLVHGIALMPDGPHVGTTFAHAWCEEAGLVWDAGLLHGERVYFGVERAQYYAAMRVQTTTVYTIRQAHEENARSGTYGPWIPAYLALVANPTRPTSASPSPSPGASSRR